MAQARLRSVGANADTAREAVLRDEGDFWTISYQGRNFRVRDVRGLRYIACLLRHPNERFHVRELAASVVGVVPPLTTSGTGFRADWENATPILDSKSKAEYRARLSELRADLEEAERMNDRGRAERIRQEVEFVNDELCAAVGLSGRDRKDVRPSRTHPPADRQSDSFSTERNSRARPLARPSSHHLHTHRLLLRLPSRSAPADVVEVLSA